MCVCVRVFLLRHVPEICSTSIYLTTDKHMRTHTHTHTHTHTLTHTNNTHFNAHTRFNTHTHTLTLTHTHTLTLTHTHTHTHTHSLPHAHNFSLSLTQTHSQLTTLKFVINNDNPFLSTLFWFLILTSAFTAFTHSLFEHTSYLSLFLCGSRVHLLFLFAL